ncbi:MAG: hypothetical protein ACLP9L_05555, partial [Thermoguttaceae bacterium]
TRCPIFLRTLLTLLIVLTGVSVSNAGLFGRWRARYDYPARPAATVSTPQAASVPAAGQPTVSTAGPIVYTVAKPVVSENAGSAAVSVPQSGSYVPAQAVSPGTSWSTLPRSSWDFGKFPPYSN